MVLTEEQANAIATEVDTRNANKQQAMFGGFSNPMQDDGEDE